MCGIVGIASGVLSAKEEKVFEGLLWVDAVRGKDSTGAAVIKKTSYDVIKKVGLPDNLLDSIKYTNALKGANCVLIGHNRWATTGKVNKLNAHPFVAGSIVGVHNGTLENKYAFDAQGTYGTDSEALYNAIEGEGVKAAISKARGAYALVWWDEEAQTLNFLRNKERTLFLAFNKDKTTLLWASEAWMLWGIAGREGIDLGKVEILPEDKHHVFTLPTLGTEPISKPLVMDVNGAPPFPVRTTPTTTEHSTSNVAYYNNKLIGNAFKGTASAVIQDGHTQFLRYRCKEAPLQEFRVYFPSVGKAEEYAQKEANILAKYMVSGNGWPKYISCDIIFEDSEDFIDLSKKVDHKGQFVSEAMFDKEYGTCAWCSSSIDYEEEWVIAGYLTCICPDCQKNEDVKAFIKG